MTKCLWIASWSLIIRSPAQYIGAGLLTKRPVIRVIFTATFYKWTDVLDCPIKIMHFLVKKAGLHQVSLLRTLLILKWKKQEPDQGILPLQDLQQAFL